MQRRLALGGLAVASVLWMGPLAAQELPLAPNVPRNDIVAPMFEGWYANPDGTFTLSFGYFNRNERQAVEIPVGPDNFIEPAEFNGQQPTSFPPRRERGVFTITVPAEFRNRDVVWTIRSRGEVHAVPGRVTSPAYELGYIPMAMGSMPPALRTDPSGPAGRGPAGVWHGQYQARVGQPLELNTWLVDDLSQREGDAAMNMAWFKHQGPSNGVVTFEPRTGRVEDPTGKFTTRATFSAPGEYVLRARGDNWGAPDSSSGDQCCWSNAYVRVTVTP
jgi:hypothetical protein